MPTHLPLLLNPLLNSLFNNPQPGQSPLRGLYGRLAGSWDGTVILVPPLDVLLHYTERDSGASYKDLCYTEAFLREHVATTADPRNARAFRTLSSKDVLLKNDVLIIKDGATSTRKVAVTGMDYFYNFNDYLRRGARFMLLHIAAPLVGTPVNCEIDYSLLKGPLLKGPPAPARPAHSTPAAPTALPATFDHLMQVFPGLQRHLLEKYQILFASFNSAHVASLPDLQALFSATVLRAFELFQGINPDLTQLVLSYARGSLDLNACLLSYIESHLYDRVWAFLTADPLRLRRRFTALRCLNLYKILISRSPKLKTDLHVTTVLEKQVNAALSELNLLQSAKCCAHKIDILTSTIKTLSNIPGVVIDADDLLNLLLIVIVNSDVLDIELHLLYIDHFNQTSTDLETGMVGYLLSTFKGLVYLLDDDDNFHNFLNTANEIESFWSHFDSKDLVYLKQCLDSNDELVHSRTIVGESLLMKAIQSNDYNVWRLIIDYENIFPLEDLLADLNIHSMNLLNVALSFKNDDIINDLIEILLNSCTKLELIQYLNTKDKFGKTIGHYLFDYQDLIPRIGMFIDWTAKDLTGQTPLFSILRSYDSANYSELVDTTFKVVKHWYIKNNSKFDYNDHIDNKGNTLLHIMNNKIEKLLNLKRININEFNQNSLTPLMIYSKYNKFDNIKKIVLDKRLDLRLVNLKKYSAVDYCKNDRIQVFLQSLYLNETFPIKLEKKFGIFKARIDNNNHIVLSVNGIFNEEEEMFKEIKLMEFLKLFKLINFEFPNNFLPMSYIIRKVETFSLNFGKFNKFKLNKLLDLLNNFLLSLVLVPPMNNHELIWKFLSEPIFNNDVLSQRIEMVDPELEPGTGAGSEVELKTIKFEEVLEVLNFLKYSIKELNKFKFNFDKLVKILNFNNLKGVETDEYHAILNDDYFNEDNNELRFLVKILKNSIDLNKNEEIIELIIYLAMSTDEIIKNCTACISIQIGDFCKIMNQLIEINYKIKDVELTKFILNNQSSFEEIVSILGIKFNKKQQEKELKSSFFVNLIDSKKIKYEKKLNTFFQVLKSDLFNKFKSIKRNHESLAIEVNDFLNFKSVFMKLLIKKYVSFEVKRLNFKKLMYERSLQDLRDVK